MEKLLRNKQKTIEDQGEKQLKAVEDNEKQLAKINMHSYENELLFQKEKYIFTNIYNERLNKIEELTLIMMI